MPHVPSVMQIYGSPPTTNSTTNGAAGAAVNKQLSPSSALHTGRDLINSPEHLTPPPAPTHTHSAQNIHSSLMPPPLSHALSQPNVPTAALSSSPPSNSSPSIADPNPQLGYPRPVHRHPPHFLKAFDDGNWEVTPELMAEIERASLAGMSGVAYAGGATSSKLSAGAAGTTAVSSSTTTATALQGGATLTNTTSTTSSMLIGATGGSALDGTGGMAYAGSPPKDFHAVERMKVTERTSPKDGEDGMGTLGRRQGRERDRDLRESPQQHQQQPHRERSNTVQSQKDSVRVSPQFSTSPPGGVVDAAYVQYKREREREREGYGGTNPNQQGRMGTPPPLRRNLTTSSNTTSETLTMRATPPAANANPAAKPVSSQTPPMVSSKTRTPEGSFPVQEEPEDDLIALKNGSLRTREREPEREREREVVAIRRGRWNDALEDFDQEGEEETDYGVDHPPRYDSSLGGRESRAGHHPYPSYASQNGIQQQQHQQQKQYHDDYSREDDDETLIDTPPQRTREREDQQQQRELDLEEINTPRSPTAPLPDDARDQIERFYALHQQSRGGTLPAGVGNFGNPNGGIAPGGNLKGGGRNSVTDQIGLRGFDEAVLDGGMEGRENLVRRNTVGSSHPPPQREKEQLVEQHGLQVQSPRLASQAPAVHQPPAQPQSHNQQQQQERQHQHPPPQHQHQHQQFQPQPLTAIPPHLQIQTQIQTQAFQAAQAQQFLRPLSQASNVLSDYTDPQYYLPPEELTNATAYFDPYNYYVRSPRPNAPIPPTPLSQTAAPSPSPLASGSTPVGEVGSGGGNGRGGKVFVPPMTPVQPVGSPYPFPFTHVRRTYGYAPPILSNTNNNPRMAFGPGAAGNLSVAPSDPNHPALVQEQLRLQLEAYARNNQNVPMSESAFSTSTTPFQGVPPGYNPWTYLHNNRAYGMRSGLGLGAGGNGGGGGKRGGGDHEHSSLQSSPSHEPVPLPAPTHRGRAVRKGGSGAGQDQGQAGKNGTETKRTKAVRKPPPRVESTQPRDTSPESVSSSGEETAGEDQPNGALGSQQPRGQWQNGNGNGAHGDEENEGDWVDEDEEGNEEDILELEFHPTFVANTAKRRRRWETRWETLIEAFQAVDRQTDATLVLLAAPSHSSKLHLLTSRSIRRDSSLAHSPALSNLRSSFRHLASERRASRSHRLSILDQIKLSSSASVADDGSPTSSIAREEDLRSALERALGSLGALGKIYEQRELRMRDEMRRIMEDREIAEQLLRQTLGPGARGGTF